MQQYKVNEIMKKVLILMLGTRNNITQLNSMPEVRSSVSVRQDLLNRTRVDSRSTEKQTRKTSNLKAVIKNAREEAKSGENNVHQIMFETANYEDSSNQKRNILVTLQNKFNANSDTG